METVLALVCAAAFSLNSLSIRVFQLKLMRDSRDIKLFQALFCVVASAAYWIMSGFDLNLTLRDILLAFAFGALFALCILASSECFICGPMSVTSVIVNSSVIVPVAFSCIFLKEAITATQIVGLLLLIATFVVMSSGSQKNGDISGRWLVLVLAAFFANGATAVIQKVYKLSAPDGGGYDFMAVAYGVSAAVMLVAALADKTKKNEKVKISSPLMFAVLALVAGLGSFAGNGLLLNLSIKMPASTLYPFVNGGLCVIVAAVSLLAFREKLTVRKIAAIACGVSAIVILNL